MPVSYRLRTELGIEAWHWTTEGTWSDPAHQQGYWTGNPESADDALVGYGYRLPYRGDTHDEANDDGYSRIDDGDATTFWKSNPYLDARYTGVPGEHRDWIVIELPRSEAIDGIALSWGLPFAKQYQVQYWVGDDAYTGRWIAFPHGDVTNGNGNRERLRLAPSPVRTRFVRVLLTRSSHMAPTGSTDPRDAVGYAVAEISLGRIASDGSMRDVIRHVANNRQTMIHVSSTDPWHRAGDRDRNTAQPSIPMLAKAGLVGHAPLMVPAGILYDTPENMTAMIGNLRERGVAIDRVELGEEPDGQLISAEDYGALYLEFSKQIRARFSEIKLGGPSLVNGVSDTWLDANPDESWTSHFVKYLSAHDGLDSLNYFSFEYFPFDDVCGSASAKLLEQPAQMRGMYKRLVEDGVPTHIPWLITEFGYSAFGGAPLVQMPSALVTADIYGNFIAQGGGTAFAYGLTPDDPIAGQATCAGRGNLMFWLSDHEGHAAWPMPSLQALRLLTKQWVGQSDALNQFFASSTSLRDRSDRAPLTSYVLQRAGGRWSVLLVNRSRKTVQASLAFEHSTKQVSQTVEVFRYGPRRYRWDHPTENSHPARDNAPAQLVYHDWDGGVLVPPMSLIVITGGWSR